MPKNIVVTVLSVTIGLFFILVGSLKLSPIFSEDVYKEMRKGFIRFAKVFPLSELTGWKPGAHNYRRVVGITEIICGLLLAFIPGRLKQVANVVLLVMLGGAVYTHYILGDSLEKMTSALIFGLLLICRYIVRYQVNTREARCLKERHESVVRARGGGGGGGGGVCTSARCRADHSEGHAGGSSSRHAPSVDNDLLSDKKLD